MLKRKKQGIRVNNWWIESPGLIDWRVEIRKRENKVSSMTVVFLSGNTDNFCIQARVKSATETKRYTEISDVIMVFPKSGSRSINRIIADETKRVFISGSDVFAVRVCCATINCTRFGGVGVFGKTGFV
jgi:hypothetical protein